MTGSPKKGNRGGNAGFPEQLRPRCTLTLRSSRYRQEKDHGEPHCRPRCQGRAFLIPAGLARRGVGHPAGTNPDHSGRTGPRNRSGQPAWKSRTCSPRDSSATGRRSPPTIPDAVCPSRPTTSCCCGGVSSTWAGKQGTNQRRPGSRADAPDGAQGADRASAPRGARCPGSAACAMTGSARRNARFFACFTWKAGSCPGCPGTSANASRPSAAG